MGFASLFQFERSIDVGAHGAISAGVNPFLEGYFRRRNRLKIVSLNSILKQFLKRKSKEGKWVEKRKGTNP